jgi:CubicO group peptidase (beta-lactamase class C family)
MPSTNPIDGYTIASTIDAEQVSMQLTRASDFRRAFVPSWHTGRLLLVAAMAALPAGCATHERADAISGDLQTSVKALAHKHRVCNVTIAVIKNRKLDTIVSGTGCVAAVAAHADSVYQAASLSKPLFAYGVMQLVAQGKLALDAPVLSYLPQGYRHQFNSLQHGPSEFVSDQRMQAITVRMVLNHTSGLPNWASGPLYFEAPPGKQFNYSGEGYVLLQRAVEAVTGQTLDEFMAAQVFKPLDMQNSDFKWTERIGAQLSPGSKANGAPRAAMLMTDPVAAFSLYTTAADYGKFLVAVLNDAPALKRLTTAPVTVDADLGLSWGLGWGMERHRDDAFIWHWGNNTGYRAFVLASVRSGEGFVMLTNSENGLALAPPLAQKILPGEHKLYLQYHAPVFLIPGAE